MDQWIHGSRDPQIHVIMDPSDPWMLDSIQCLSVPDPVPLAVSTLDPVFCCFCVCVLGFHVFVLLVFLFACFLFRFLDNIIINEINSKSNIKSNNKCNSNFLKIPVGFPSRIFEILLLLSAFPSVAGIRTQPQ